MYVLPLSFVIKWIVRTFLTDQCGCACILYHFTALRSPFSDYVSCWQIPSNTTSGVTSLWEAWKRWAKYGYELCRAQGMNVFMLNYWASNYGRTSTLWECCGYSHCKVLTFSTSVQYRSWTGFEHHKSTYIIGYEDKCPIGFYFIQAVSNYFSRMMDLVCTFHCSLWNSVLPKPHMVVNILFPFHHQFVFMVDWVIL